MEVWLWGQDLGYVGGARVWGAQPHQSHQQLLWDELHDQLLGPLVRLPAVGGASEAIPCILGRPRLCPLPHSQVLALVHIGLAGQGALQLCCGVREGSTLLQVGGGGGKVSLGGRVPGATHTLHLLRDSGGPASLTSCHSSTPLQASSLLLSRCSFTASPPRVSPGEEGPIGPRAPKTRAPSCSRGENS